MTPDPSNALSDAPEPCTSGGPSRSGNRIVVGVDGTPASLAALDWAAREARRRRAVVEVVTAWPRPEEIFIREVPGHYNVARGEAVRAQERAIADLTRDLGGGLGEVVGEIENAHPAVALARRSDGADLLVVGAPRPAASRGATTVSVAQLCDLLARCPVVVVEAS